MKRLSTLFLVLTALLALPLSVHAEEATATFDFQNNNGNWTIGNYNGSAFDAGDLTAPLTMGEVTLTGINGNQPCRLMADNNDVIALYVYANASATGGLKFNAAEGRALKKIEVTMKSGNFDFEASTGALTEATWEGNASEVTFMRTGTGNRQMLKIVVTTDAENGETVKPEAPVWDIEAKDIAAFNAAEDGKLVKLTLNNARVNGSFNGYYVEDASGATVIKGITLEAGTALNGYIVGTKSTDSSIDMNEPAAAVEYQLTATDASTFEATAAKLDGTVMSIPDACAQATYAKLVTLQDVTIDGSGRNKTLTDANGNTIKARDYMGVLSSTFTWPEKAAKITGVVIYYMTGWFIMPISDEAVVAAGVQPTSVTFDFASANIRPNIGETLTDEKGYIINETFAADNVTLQITAGSAPARIYADENRGQNLVTFKEYTTLTFKAPTGYAITKVEFTAAGTSNIKAFTASSGAVEGMVWTGNADGVRFTQGGTSYLANAIVTLAATDAATTALPAIEYTECENIAAFNALTAGTYAKVKLTDAEVIGVSADKYSTVFIQDATGGCWIQYTSLNAILTEKTEVNGYVYVVKRLTAGNAQMKEAEDTPDSELTIDQILEYTVVEGTLADVNIAANKNKLVKITGATLEETSATLGTLTQGDATIAVNNGTETTNQQLHKIADWAANTKLENVTIVAILVGKSSTENQLLPISITTGTNGITTIANGATSADAQIYNLQGVRLNQLQRGVNIVNGKKVVVK